MCSYRSHPYQGSSLIEGKGEQSTWAPAALYKLGEDGALGKGDFGCTAVPCVTQTREIKALARIQQEREKSSLFSHQCLTVSARLPVTVPKCCTALELGETGRHVPAAVGPGPVPLMAPQRLMLNAKGTGQVDSTACQYFVPSAF